MALTNVKGLPTMMFDPGLPYDGNAVAFSTVGLLDASTEKTAFIGQVWHPTVKTGTINIRKVHFRCGAVTLNVLSAFRVSLQNLSLTSGPPYQPDGTQDQTYDFTTLTANGWNTSGNLSADRAVDLSADSPGDANSRWLAVVFEYQTFTALDSVIVSGMSKTDLATTVMTTGAHLLNTGSWGVQFSIPIVALECDDGTFAFLEGCPTFSALSNVGLENNGSVRRAGVKIQVPVELKVDRFSMRGLVSAGGDGTIDIYDSDGTTVLRSITIDSNTVSSNSNNRNVTVVFEPLTLAASTYYRIVWTATTTTTSYVYYADVNAAGLQDGLIFGQEAHWTQHNGTSWSDTTTRRPHFSLGISAVHDGAGGGGGGPLIGGRLAA